MLSCVNCPSCHFIKPPLQRLAPKCTRFSVRSSLYRSSVPKVMQQHKLFSSFGNRHGDAKITCQAANPALSSNFESWKAGNSTPTGGPQLSDRIRAIAFYTLTLVLSIPLMVVMLIQHPFVLLFDKFKRKAHHHINKIWACLTMRFFYEVIIEGEENLPGPDEPAVYVANHQSFLDIYTLFQLGRPFKFISKTSIFFFPIVGWSMFLTGHVPLRRLDKRSQLECLRRCTELVRNGASVFFFPEGTRSTDGKMAGFKKGAFSIAAKTGVPVVPISLIGTGDLMPNKMEGTLKPGGVKVVIHPPIRGNNADELCKQSRKLIGECLVSHGYSIH